MSNIHYISTDVLSLEDVQEIVDEHIAGGKPVERLRYRKVQS